MDYYTQTADRPDLAQLDVNLPEGYIGTTIVPVREVGEKAGSAAYATLTAATAAQTGRVAGVAPTTTQIANSAHAWACTEIIERAGVTPDEAKQMGGIDKADKVGSDWAKRSVLSAREALIVAQVLGTADGNFDAAKIRTDFQTGLQTIRQYPGRTALVGATITLKAMVQAILGTAGVGDAFARIVTGANAAEAAMGLSFDAWKRGVALFLGVDDVLAGDDDIWAAGTAAEKVALVKIENSGDPLAHKYKPVFGKCIQFMPDGGNGFEVQSIADRLTLNNIYDAKLWADVEIYNAAAVYVFDGVAA